MSGLLLWIGIGIWLIPIAAVAINYLLSIAENDKTK